ncbi:TRAP transporter small permease subunit [Pelagibius sp.]|uniref:TRAP transporter small permease subunit n=1 Tax=Pelagibius sp. TaxID=1931238 RepID=UPI003BB0995C
MNKNAIQNSIALVVSHLERLVHFGVWVNGAALILVAFMIGFDVIARKMFNVSVGGADEIGGYFLAISSAWAASFTLFKHNHIRMDVVHARLPERGQRLLDLLALLALFAFVGTVAWYANEMWMKSFSFGSRANTPLLTPLWIPQGLWLIGLAMFLVTTTAAIVATIGVMCGVTSPELTRLAIKKSPEDDVRDQIRELEAHPADSSDRTR